jgi:two-component system, LuxR family, response regulator FixJ
MGDVQQVFVVDDDPALRESLGTLLESAGLPFEVFSCAEDFLKRYERGRRGCIVLDVRMQGMGGMELLEQLESDGIALPVIVITAHADVQMTVRAFKAGAVDFLEKPFRAGVLLDRIQFALQRERLFGEARRSRNVILERLQRLTKRERHVYDLLVKGRSIKEIAAELRLSPKTIQIYRTNVLAKMEAHSPAQLVLLTEGLRFEEGDSTRSGQPE